MSDDYNVKSCSSLEKSYYTPLEAALRWCNLIEHEIDIFKKCAHKLSPDIDDFPLWPCLRLNVEKIIDGTNNEELKHGRDGKNINDGDHVAVGRRTVRHNDLKLWMAKYYPDQKPKFLFDEVERTTHTSINKDAFIALQVENEASKARLANAEIWAKDAQLKIKDLTDENKSLRAKAAINETALDATERVSMINIIHALAKNGYKYPNHGSLSDIVKDFQLHSNGTAENTLTKYLKMFNNL